MLIVHMLRPSVTHDFVTLLFQQIRWKVLAPWNILKLYKNMWIISVLPCCFFWPRLNKKIKINTVIWLKGLMRRRVVMLPNYYGITKQQGVLPCLHMNFALFHCHAVKQYFFSQPRILTSSVLSFSLSRSISTHSHWNSLSNNNRLVNTMICFWNDCNDIIWFHKNRCNPLFFTKNFFHHPSLLQSYRLVRWLMSKASYNRRSAAVQPRSTAEVQRLSDPPAREGWEKKRVELFE